MIDITTLPMGSIIIAPSHLHSSLRVEILKQQKGLLGLRLLSLSSFLSTFIKDTQHSFSALLFQYRELCKEQYTLLSTYQDAALTPTFLKECYEVLDDIKYWQIPLTSLPENTQAQKEIKYVLTKFYPLHTKVDDTLNAITKLKAFDCSHVYIYESYVSLEDKMIVDILLQNHATLLQNQHVLKEKHFYHAVNKRQEVEACAQYIIEHKLSAEDIHITLCDSTYTPLIEQIFERYQIPCTGLQQTSASILTKRVKALLCLYLQKDVSSLLECLDVGAFPIHEGSALQTYLQLYQKDIEKPFVHLQELQDIGNILDSFNVKKLSELELQAEELRMQYLPIFHTIIKAPSYERLFTSILTILQETIDQTPSDIKLYTSIQTFLQDIYPYIVQDDDLRFALPLLDSIQQQDTKEKLGGVLLTSLTQTGLSHPYHFMLGCTQQMYPAFTSKSGIFDEPYYRLLAYPSLEDRYMFHTQQLSKQIMQADVLIASYPLGTYEGKSLESALEIEQFMGVNAKKFPLYQNYQAITPLFSINEATTQELFVRDGTLRGSISSLERYVKCPFSYFLRYGLGLREPMKYDFADSYMGTLSHYMMETLVSQMGKTYTQTAKETIKQLLNKEIASMQNVFVHMEAQLACVKQRIEDAVIQTLKRLHDFEEHSHLTPWKQEYEFHYDIPLTNAVSLSLHGFIDRIDADSNFACVLDYKSSAKTLSEATVFAALQLQLLTYSIVVEEASKKQILGAYYISLKNENITQIAGKITRRKPVIYTEIASDEMHSLAQKQHRLNGWTMHSMIDVMDDDASHISGIRQNKDGIIKASKPYDLTILKHHFIQMYQQIGERILSSNFPIEPNEEACMFCQYNEICRFHGSFITKQPLLETDDTLYLKGEEKDA